MNLGFSFCGSKSAHFSVIGLGNVMDTTMACSARIVLSPGNSIATGHRIVISCISADDSMTVQMTQESTIMINVSRHNQERNSHA